jgi:hypothetical protein
VSCWSTSFKDYSRKSTCNYTCFLWKKKQNFLSRNKRSLHYPKCLTGSKMRFKVLRMVILPESCHTSTKQYWVTS